MNKPYHERPDWILKSIVYYCDNYTIDGEDLGKHKRGAIAEYLFSNKGFNIDSALFWTDTKQGFAFWAYLWYLHTGDPGRQSPHDAKCSPWTDYEKRKIAKMPEPI
jgi:hypothetical protein